MQTDPRVEAFCAVDGPEIFRPVAYPTEVWYPDLLDVEAIYADARELYEGLLRRATAPDEGHKVGRILLLRGESGSGKTHLMRAFRTRAHQQALGYFGYMQMTTSSGNYSRYILQKLIDSLDQPYYRTPASPDDTTGLMRLSTAVAESARLAPHQVRRLQEDTLGNSERAELVLDLADEAVRDPMLRDTPIDLVRAMLFLQSGHPAIRSRVMKYLRAEPLSDHDRQRLGGVSPLDRDESAQAMIERLGRLMWTVHGAALILCVDQLEDIALYEGAEEKFRRAVKGLTQVAAQVPSALIVVACLEDYYDVLRGHLDKSALDRIENDPAPLTLQGGRTWDEIRAVVGLHLSHLFDHFDLPASDELATYPIPDRLLREQVKQTTRAVLTACKAYRDQCVRAGRLVPSASDNNEGIELPASQPTHELEQSLLEFDQAWNDFLANFEQVPLENDQQLVDLLAESIELCSDEVDTDLRYTTETDGLDIEVHTASRAGDFQAPLRLARVCNNAPQAGSLGKQIEGLLERASNGLTGTTPIVVRSAEYQPKTPRSTIARLFAQLYARAGSYLIVRDSDWRTMAAIQPFRLREQELPHFETWLRRAQPLARLASLRELVALDARRSRPESTAVAPAASQTDVHPQRPGEATAAAAEVDGEHLDRSAPQPTAVSAESVPIADEKLLVGYTRNRAQQSASIPIDSLVMHTAFLGGTGSGKTTAALNLIEQLLVRGVPALLVDRKGDLISYACDELWNRAPEDPLLAERHRRLRATLDVAVYTPGCSDGRPIALSVAPEGMGQMKTAERRQVALQAAHLLGGMLGYKPVGKNAPRISIMIKAIELMAELSPEPITLKALIDYINERDDALLSAIGVLDVRLFDSLLEALQTLSINKQPLFPTQGEPLRAEDLFGLGPAGRDGKTRLSVISTKFLGDSASIQFWVAQLLLELSRWLSKEPTSELQAVVLFDEADLYLPATSKPATKEPMESLLKRARSAGLGVMLATQSPGDLDYKCRENINTWLLGKIKEDAAIKKMKPMLSECSRDVGADLAGQQTGDFFLVQHGQVTAVRSQRSVVAAHQLPEHEILQIARGQCPRR